MPTQEQYNVSKQPIQNKHIKIELLNFDFETVDELSGNCIDGNISIDANSDIRRTCYVELVVTDSSFEVEAGSRIWLDRYIRVYIGIDDIRTGETVWFNQGVYLIDAPSYDYDSTKHTLHFSALDLMSKLTGKRNGYIVQSPIVIEQDESVRDSIINIVKQLGGFTKYIVEDCTLSDGTVQPVPYDIRVETGGTLYDLLSQLRDIMPNYQIYFDVDGVFHYDKIPTGDDEAIVANDDLFRDVVISEAINNDFSKVKNSIVVYGLLKEPAYFATKATVSSGHITATIPDVTEYKNGAWYGFVLNSSIYTNPPTLNVNGLGQLNITLSNGSQDINLEKGKYYVVQCQKYTKSSKNRFLFLGEQQSVGYARDTNKNSPFDINKIGEIAIAYSGGEYDNIVSTELATERAEWELYKATRLQEDVSLEIIPVYWLDVNQLIEHGIKGNHNQDKYIIKSIRFDLNPTSTMNITAIKYYSLYPTT